MLNKLWKSYSYAIILFVLSLAASLIMLIETPDTEKFVKVTVAEGDSLWKIAENFSAEHSLSTDQFIIWVERNNGIAAGRIFPGDEIVIPVKALDDQSYKELASSNLKE
ncbi:cell division suppressor protein YneA [Cytobacillus firmus]|uniref:cell division suppressor protein YneA n=1 Tax=Cytobacillus firmus TaxID=1399 RepID=UPI00077C7940|nr:LysM peptidoglycan-binding domain-containing protein [Cytobacillus firmus]MBG9542025.1 cell division suppressor protein YneA [Cytobacillus firmus]MBG9551661.1 cell division suppressor protein YneA [Cytobacillus firmus]MBG9556236.1 cell division suppressor protein YneA [Cytobacillus firmus]MBG9576078.1 cell division suppressor protein YneA [Cytobacillus firmus]MEC1895225.1 LysM peptidoglycan-binding domain-containing protein [Cytobacillus firmus]